MAGRQAGDPRGADAPDEVDPAALEVDPDDLPADVVALGYEEAREALVDVVRRLESGGATLEESLALWERGEALATRCEQWLDGARTRVEEAVSRREAPRR